MGILVVVVVAVIVLFLLGTALSARIVKQYEEGVLFRLGRVQGPRDPGFRLIIPFADVLHRYSVFYQPAGAGRPPAARRRLSVPSAAPPTEAVC